MNQELLDKYRDLEQENEILLSEIERLNKALSNKDIANNFLKRELERNEKESEDLKFEIDYLYDIQIQDMEQLAIAKEEIRKLKNTVKTYEDYLYNQ